MKLSDFINETDFAELTSDGVIVGGYCKASEYQNKED